MMLVLLALSIGASSLKLAQHPDLETLTPEMVIETIGIGEECTDRMNYKCFKKGGHSVEKEDAGTFLRREQGVVSVGILIHTNCVAGVDLLFSEGVCTGVNAVYGNAESTAANKYRISSDDVLVTADGNYRAITIGTTVKGDRCLTTSVPTLTSMSQGTGSPAGECVTDHIGDFTISGLIRDSATTGLAHFTMRMDGFGLHSGGVPKKAATATDNTICHTLSCVKGEAVANTCASAPAATLFKSMIWYCAGASISAKMDNHAACASLDTVIDVGNLGDGCHHMKDHFLCDATFSIPTCP